MGNPPRTLPRTADGVSRCQGLGEGARSQNQLQLYAPPPDLHGLHELGVARGLGRPTPPHSAYPHGGLAAPSHRHWVVCIPCRWGPQTQAVKPIVTLRFCPASVGPPCSWTHGPSPWPRPALVPSKPETRAGNPSRDGDLGSQPQSEGHPVVAGNASILRAG